MSNRHKFIKSTALSHCDYNDEDGTLEICFTSGSTHHFKCDKSEYHALKDAASPGGHFHKAIRGKYREVKK